MKKIFLLIIMVGFALHLCFAESEVSFKAAPVLQIPLGLTQTFNTGFGAAVSLDYSFYTLTPGLDLGFRAGAVVYSISVKAGDPLSVFEGQLGAFLNYKPKSMERWSFNAGLSAGVYNFSRGDTSEAKAMFSISLGTDFRLTPYFSLYAESAYSGRIFSPQKPLDTIGFSVGMRLNLSEIMGGRSRIQLEKTDQFRVFPVSWAWYENNPVAMLKMTNEEPNTITGIELSIILESYMSEPWVFANLDSLAPGESIELPVTALFNDVMISLTENTIAAGSIIVQYRSLGARKEIITPVQMPIFHRNAFSWEDDRRAAAFVSPRDSSAFLFARYVAGAVEEILDNTAEIGNLPGSIVYATAMFEALRLYGISYVVVPASSYRNLSANEAVLDNVSYPYQALYYRGGDCSYLSILFCSLLEAINIETAFITIPGHIYIAFEIDNDEYNNDELIELDGKRWLPVEITVPEQGFTRAWHIGFNQWRNYGNEAALHPIRDAWKIYPSVTVPASGDHLPLMPARDEIINAMVEELQKF